MKAKDWIGKIIWIGNGKMEVDRGRVLWELLFRSSLEHPEVWLTGG